MAVGLAAVSLCVGARADLRSTYAVGPIIYPGGATPSINALCANHNPGSPYYGYVYVLERISHKVLIYRPNPLTDRAGANSYADTGLTITIPSGGSLDPFVGAVGPDDAVWLGAASLLQVMTAPPVPPSGTDVSAVKQIDLTGSGINGSAVLRGLTVAGPISNAKVYMTAGNAPAGVVQEWSGSATDVATTGTFSKTWAADLAVAPYSITQGPYGPAVDPAGNLYVAAKGGYASVLLKISPAGVPDTTWSAPPPAGLPVTGNLGSAAFVPDASYAGGGYLYYMLNIAVSGAQRTFGLRYTLDGAYLDGWGPALTTPPANYSVLNVEGVGSAGVPYADIDVQGNLYVRFRNAGNSAVIKVFKRQPAAIAAGAAASAPAAVKSSPTAVDGVAYFGSDDGKLYAYTTVDGAPVAGFPVDISAYVGGVVKVQSRAAVYYGNDGKAIYVTTDRGDVVRVNPDGTAVWKYSVLAAGTANVSTPAVTPDGLVYVGVNSANGVYALKLDQATGAFVAASPLLAPVATGAISSPAVSGTLSYFGLKGGATGDLVVLGSDLTPLASMAAGEGITAPPYVIGADAFYGTLAGNLYKVNSVTLTPDPTFGTEGHAAIGEPLPTSLFPLTSGSSTLLYAGSSMGKVWKADVASGAGAMAFDTGDATAVVGGLTVNPAGGPSVVFGTSAGKFYILPAGAADGVKVFGGYGPLNTTPTLDRSTNRFFAGCDDGNLYAFPAN
jgi:hypothetical protein